MGGGHERSAYQAARARGEKIERYSVFLRDHRRCQLCGDRVDLALRWPNPASPSLDHIVPIARGGEHVYTNVQLAHLVCNLRKGARRAA